MAILWCGGEDIDWPTGGTITVTTTAANFRAGYARCAITTATASVYQQTLAFAGGAVTSCWLSFRVITDSSNFASVTATLIAGFVNTSAASSGLWVGGVSVSGGATKLGLYTFDGASKALLASESGNSLSPTPMIHRVDVQLVSYGATATVNVYLDGTLLITFSGDVRIGGLTNVNAVGINGLETGSTRHAYVSEVIVADEDLRAFPGLVTLALTGAGTTNSWTNTTFSNINGTTISDANPTSSNTTAQDNEYNVTDLPAGTFVIKAVKISARLAKSASPAVTQVKLGYKNGANVGFGTGATKAATTAYATYEQLDATDPTTSSAFIQGDMNGLQLDMQSLT